MNLVWATPLLREEGSGESCIHDSLNILSGNDVFAVPRTSTCTRAHVHVTAQDAIETANTFHSNESCIQLSPDPS